MYQASSHLEDISLVTNNFGDALVFADILQDWFDFLGGKPGEVVVVDCGSDRETQEIYWQLFQEGLIDKLQVIQSYHEDNYGGVESGYKKEYTAGAIASKPYLLWFHVDTLPFRKGHDLWLAEAIAYLDRSDVFAVGGSFNLPSKHRSAWDGWYFSNKCSLNFTLMKRSMFMEAVHEFAGDFITSGFRGNNPADAFGEGRSRFIFELAFEQYIQRHNRYTLCKVEDINWTVFHTNVHGERLKKTREKYLSRQKIKPYLNIGNSTKHTTPPQPIYYGQPLLSLFKKIQIWIGSSSLGPYWRSLKRLLLGQKSSAES
jgi:hypothetical protein